MSNKHNIVAETVNRKLVQIDYTNYRGERSLRQVLPRRMYWGTSSFHPGKQWLLDAFDIEKRADRTFAMRDIHSWRPDGAEA